jgi:phage tail-like protein
MQTATNQASILLKYLPAIYQESGWGGEDPAVSAFIGDFLVAFEKVLLGREDGIEPKGGSAEFLGVAPRRFQGVEEKIAGLHALFDAARTPACFLDWLASWSALTLPMELSEPRRRALLANMIPLYRIRGTKTYIERLLALFIGGGATVDDHSEPGFQIGRTSTIAKNTYLGGSTPHFFRVRLSLPAGEESRSKTLVQLSRQLLELAKPAHTYYQLEFTSSRLQIGVHSRVGVDTFLA